MLHFALPTMRNPIPTETAAKKHVIQHSIALVLPPRRKYCRRNLSPPFHSSPFAQRGPKLPSLSFGGVQVHSHLSPVAAGKLDICQLVATCQLCVKYRFANTIETIFSFFFNLLRRIVCPGQWHLCHALEPRRSQLTN